MDRVALAAGLFIALVIVALPNGGAVDIVAFDTDSPPAIRLSPAVDTAPPRPQPVVDTAPPPAPLPSRPAPPQPVEVVASPAPLRTCARVEAHRVRSGAVPASTTGGVVRFADGSRCRLR